MKFSALAGFATAVLAQEYYDPNYQPAYAAPQQEANYQAASYDPSIVPEYFAAAVHDWDMYSPSIDQDSYAKQVDIYSDEIIAIEAIRLEVLQITQRVEQAEDDFQIHQAIIADNRAKISANSRATLDNAEAIMALDMDVNDLMMTLQRQWTEQETNRRVLELYCHQYTYVANIPPQCEAVLASGTILSHHYAWPEGDRDMSFPAFPEFPAYGGWY